MRLGIVIVAALLVAACGSPTTAQKEKLSALQGVVNEQVSAGKMTQAEGRLVMARAREDIDAEWRRNYVRMVSGGDGPAVYQPVGGGTVIRY
jgi:polyhydroxyalkanoate synthesis regulator phasin